MKKISNFLIVIILAAGLMAPASAAAQSSALYPNRGGTGTTTIPTFGKVLMGQTNGTYGPTATSTLKINTSDLIEGSNLFFTNARSWFSITSSSTIRDYLNWWEKNTSGDISYTHGNVGIKATNPAAELVVGGTINTQLINVASTTATSTFNGNVKIEGNLELSGLAFFTVVSSGNMSVAGNLTVTGTTEARGKIYSSTGALTIDQNGQSNGAIVLNPTSGNVGIGDTNPSSKLSVTGNSYLTGNLTVTGTSALGTISSGTWGGTVIPLTKGGLGADFSAAAGLGYFSAGTASALNTSSALATVMTDETGSAGSLVFSGAPTFTGNTTLAGATVTNSTTTNATSTNESITTLTATRATITGLIATNSTTTNATSTNQSATLLTATTGVITGLTSTNSTSTNATSTTLNVSSRATFPGSGVWTSSGNLGIGTTDPGEKLDIVGGNLRLMTLGGHPDRDYIKLSVNSYEQYIDTGASSALVFRVDNGNTPMLKIMTGKIGIGTSSPSARLAINGPSAGGTGRAFVVSDYVNAERFTVLDNGNVGIATTTPAMKLDVYGQIRATNPTKPTCTAALRGAIQYDVSDDHFYGCRATGWAQLDN